MVATRRLNCAKHGLYNSSNAMAIRMTERDPNKPKRPSSMGDFDTVKLIATGLEEKRVRDDKDKTKILKAARLKKIESE